MFHYFAFQIPYLMLSWEIYLTKLRVLYFFEFTVQEPKQFGFHKFYLTNIIQYEAYIFV